MKVTLHVEGGGSKALNRECRKGFGKFLSNAGAAKGVSVVACGPRGDAYQRFKKAHARGNGVSVLLVDAEGPVGEVPGSWQHLEASDSWDRPSGAKDEQCHLMVEIMESWFLADTDTLESFYGDDFQKQRLPANQKTEQVAKQDVFRGLEQASADTGKGPYSKGRHSYAILAKLDTERVRKASPHANRLIQNVKAG